MRRTLAISAASCLAISPQAFAIPRTSPPIPSQESFKDCRPMANPGPFDLGKICVQVGSPKEFGKPVDGNPQRIHATWRMIELVIASGPNEGAHHEIRQAAYDCTSRRAVDREVVTFITLKGQYPAYKPTASALRWTPLESDFSFMQPFCPLRKGYVRLNDSIVNIGGAIRSGSRVNVGAKLDNGREGVYAIDCQHMLIGYNRQPYNPIAPGSVGHEIYKKVCR